MLGFLKHKPAPIGVDLGAAALKMLQLGTSDKEVQLIAAAKAEVPLDLLNDPRSRYEWYAAGIKRMLASHPFRGRRVITCLSGRELLIQHLRSETTDRDKLGQTLVQQAREHLPFDVNRALMRHIVAGELYEDAATKLEVILMAAGQDVVGRHLAVLEKGRVDIDSINVEPCVLIGAFTPLLQQSENQQQALMFIDMGYSATKIVVAHGRRVAFVRTLRIGGRHLTQADEPTVTVKTETAQGPDMVSRNALEALIEDIRRCVRYHNQVFSQLPVGRVVFIGGLAKEPALCRLMAPPIALPACQGDPLARLSDETRYGKHSDLVCGENHSEWTVAFGLSLAGLQALRQQEQIEQEPQRQGA